MKMKKLISGVLVVLLSTSMLTGCANHQQKITKDDLMKAVQEMNEKDKQDLVSMLKDTESNNKEKQKVKKVKDSKKEQQEVKQVKNNNKEQQEVKQIKENSKKEFKEIRCSVCGAREGEKIGIEYRSEFGRIMCEGCFYHSVDAAMQNENKYCAICGSTKNLSPDGTTCWICESCKIQREQQY